jgi:hypothetical protein
VADPLQFEHDMNVSHRFRILTFVLLALLLLDQDAFARTHRRSTHHRRSHVTSHRRSRVRTRRTNYVQRRPQQTTDDWMSGFEASSAEGCTACGDPLKNNADARVDALRNVRSAVQVINQNETAVTANARNAVMSTAQLSRLWSNIVPAVEAARGSKTGARLGRRSLRGGQTYSKMWCARGVREVFEGMGFGKISYTSKRAFAVSVAKTLPSQGWTNQINRYRTSSAAPVGSILIYRSSDRNSPAGHIEWKALATQSTGWANRGEVQYCSDYCSDHSVDTGNLAGHRHLIGIFVPPGAQ